jgi:hypothetical protein
VDSGKGQSTGDSNQITAEFKPQDGDSNSRRNMPGERAEKPKQGKLIIGDGAPRKPVMGHESHHSGWNGIGNVPGRRD